MSIHRSSARHSSASRRSSEEKLRDALLDARRGTVTHRATIDGLIWEPDIFLARQVKHNTNSAKRYITADSRFEPKLRAGTYTCLTLSA